MKLFKTLTCLLILSLGFASYSEAKGRSFGGGFRSQRMAPAPRVQRAPQPQAAPSAQAAPATQPKSMFGSFGRAKPATTDATPQSGQPLNMSKDLNTNAAQGNALKANDARTATGATAGTGAAGGASNSGWFRSGNPSAAKSAPVQATAQPGVMQQRGGGFLNNAMWFMLGSSLARSHQPAANQNIQNENHQGNIVNTNDETSLSNVDGQVAEPLADMSPPVEEKESFFMSLLRLTLWAAIIFGLYKLVTSVMRTKKNNLNKKPNYTFGN
jgi:hypothetical protein